MSTDNYVKVTLWGDFTTNFTINHLYNEEAGNVVVVLFVGCMPREIFSKYMLLQNDVLCSIAMIVSVMN